MGRNARHGVSRRRFIVGMGGAAASLAVPSKTFAQRDADDETDAVDAVSATLRLEEIQGNVFAGFNKDHQALVLFGLPTQQVRARR